MHGTKAINFYMLVERDRWVGGPIMRDNRRRPGYYDFCRRFSRLIHGTGIVRSQKIVPAVLLANRDYERLAGVSALFSQPSRQFMTLPYPEVYLSEERWGFRRAIALEAYRWWRRWNQALSSSGCTFDLADSDLPLERLRRYSVVVIPGYDFMSRELQEKLVAYVRAGGNLILGPDVPYLDDTMTPCRVLAEHISLQAPQRGGGRIVVLPDAPPPAALTEMLAQLGASPLVRASDASVDVTVHRLDSHLLIYVANPTPESKTVALASEHLGRLRDLWTGDVFTPDAVALFPYTIRILEPASDDQP